MSKKLFLEITYSDEDNEFQCSWIELLNEKRPNILVGVYYRYPKLQKYVTVTKLQ